MNLFGKGRDWSLAPVSGSAIILAHFWSITHWFWLGDLEKAILWAILASVWTIQRDRYLENEDGQAD